MHFRLCRLHLAVLERAGELELRGFEMELVDHVPHAPARNHLSGCVSQDLQGNGEKGRLVWQEDDVNLLLLGLLVVDHRRLYSFFVTHLPSSVLHSPITCLNSSILPTSHPLMASSQPSNSSIRLPADPNSGLFFSAQPNRTLLPALQDPGRQAHCMQD